MDFHARILCLVLVCAPLAAPTHAADAPGDWSCYGRDAGGLRYAPLDQINRENVGKLQVAWTFRTGELERVKGSPLADRVTFEATPIVAGGVLYVSTATARVFALDAASGRELWAHDSKMNLRLIFSEGASRGVSLWQAADDSKERRVFLGTLDARLWALDATSGKPCDDFGDGGQVDLSAGLPRTLRGMYSVTSPPAIVGDSVIVGSAITETGKELWRSELPAGGQATPMTRQVGGKQSICQRSLGAACSNRWSGRCFSDSWPSNNPWRRRTSVIVLTAGSPR
jgi:quinoprotein glucose dehydrogenase